MANTKYKYCILLSCLLSFSFTKCVVNIKNDENAIKTIRNGDNRITKQEYNNKQQLLREYEALEFGNDSVMMHGFYKEYYSSGKLKVVTFFRSGVLDTTVSFFYPNGNIERKYYYHEGELFGNQYKFDEDGCLKYLEFLPLDTALAPYRISLNDAGNFNHVEFLPLDTAFYSYRISFDKAGSIMKVEGKLTVFQPYSDSFKAKKEASINTYVPLLPKTKTVFKFSIREEKSSLSPLPYDDTVYHFIHYKNTDFFPLKIAFPKPGVYKYITEVDILDSLSNKPILRDTNQFSIKVYQHENS